MFSIAIVCPPSCFQEYDKRSPSVSCPFANIVITLTDGNVIRSLPALTVGSWFIGLTIT